MHKDFILNNKINKEVTLHNFLSEFLEHFSISLILPNFWYNARFINFSKILKKKPYKVYKLHFYYTLYNPDEYVYFKIFKKHIKDIHKIRKLDNFKYKQSVRSNNNLYRNQQRQQNSKSTKTLDFLLGKYFNSNEGIKEQKKLNQ